VLSQHETAPVRWIVRRYSNWPSARLPVLRSCLKRLTVPVSRHPYRRVSPLGAFPSILDMRFPFFNSRFLNWEPLKYDDTDLSLRKAL